MNRAGAAPPCTGFDPRTGSFGLLFADVQHPNAECPPGSAIMFHVPVLGPERPLANVSPEVSCCPLPPDALLPDSEHVHSIECPDFTVATGIIMTLRSSDARHSEAFEYALRCTVINHRRYRLSAPAEIRQMEYGKPLRIGGGPGAGIAHTSWGLIPATLRYGIGRLSRTQWTPSGCVGVPWGSILTRRGGRGCEGFVFRELLPLGDHEAAEATSSVSGNGAGASPWPLAADCPGGALLTDSSLGCRPRTAPQSGSRLPGR